MLESTPLTFSGFSLLSKQLVRPPLMTQSDYKPKLFIASSSEGLVVARLAKELLSTNTVPTLWEEDVFLPGTITLEVLEDSSPSMHSR